MLLVVQMGIIVKGVKDNRTIRSMIANGDADEDIIAHFKITKKELTVHKKRIEEEKIAWVHGW